MHAFRDGKISMSADFFRSKRFVVMMACLTGLAAMGIDSVLPAFPSIIEYFHIPASEQNKIHQVVFVFVLGLASLQLVFGTLSDVLGRKTVLIAGLSLYAVATIAILFVNSFEQLLIARFIQGMGLGAPRVLAMTIIRDKTSGAEMSRISSFVLTVFITIPIVAPMLGQLIVNFSAWKGVFLFLVLFGISLLIWISLSLPETLPPENRMPLSFSKLKLAATSFMGNWTTQAYLLMISLLFGMLMTFVSLAQQILQSHVYHLGHAFPFYFAFVVTGVLIANFTNAKFVMTLGMRKMLSYGLTALVMADGMLFLLVMVNDGIIPLWTFMLIFIVHFLGFGLSMPNLNALAMQPYKHIGGTAAALIGTISTVLGILVAQIISHFFDGTLYCIGIGFICCTITICGLYVLTAKVPNHLANSNA